jgi:hypothetical protein
MLLASSPRPPMPVWTIRITAMAAMSEDRIREARSAR